jgi:hypothetical protein
MDLRDPWYDSGTTPAEGTPMLTRLHRGLFRHYAPQAALLVANTEPHRRHLERALGARARPTAYVPNGFDPVPATPRSTDARATPFSIGHFGQIPVWRSPTPFLEGLRRWLDRRPSAADRVSARFVGGRSEEARLLAESLHLTGVSFEPRVARAEVPGLMAAQYVLLVLANDQRLQVPGKAYEYLAASRRVLACTEHDSATADLLVSAPGCAIAASPEGVADALERWWVEYSAGAGAHVDRSALLASMTYRRRAEQFAELLRDVANGSVG